MLKFHNTAFEIRNITHKLLFEKNYSKKQQSIPDANVHPGIREMAPNWIGYAFATESDLDWSVASKPKQI